MEVLHNVIDGVRNIDAYPKIEAEFMTRTRTGACVSLVSVFLILALGFGEIWAFFDPDITHSLIVDSSRHERLNIEFNITFPKLDCALLQLDAMDDSGDHQLKSSKTSIRKVRLNKDGSLHQEEMEVDLGGTLKKKEHLENLPTQPKIKHDCGSCFGAGEEGQCCNTCDDVRLAYKAKGWAFTAADKIKLCVQEHVNIGLISNGELGCNVEGNIELAKVGGNIHFAPSDALQHAQLQPSELVRFAMSEVDLSHTIHKFSFGATIPGIEYPLVNVVKDMNVTRQTHNLSKDQSGMYQYYIKVVPTSYTNWKGDQKSTNQYAVTTHFRTIDHLTSSSVPGVFFFFELSAIRMDVVATSKSFGHFMTSLMAIVGGVFAVLGLVDNLLHNILNKS